MVGSSRVQKVNVRVVSASHRNLNKMISQEKFREDLFYRLNVVEFEIPPLRDRGDDVLLLTNYFLHHLAERHGRTFTITDNVLQALRKYDWPGNVRELENLIHRLAILVNEGESIDQALLPAHIRGCPTLPPRGGFIDRTIAEVEQEHILAVLAHTKGNKTQAAKILGINRKTLREKLQRYQ